MFIDELYFLACGEHLSWGYVDMPPLTALQAWTVRTFVGDSLLAIRLIPALAGVGLVLLTGALVRHLGGGRFAQALAVVAVLVAPFYLSFDSYLSMNSVEPLLWMGCVLMLIRMIKTGDTRLWLWFGVIAGVGLENKDTMLLFGFALIAGLLMTPERRLMSSRWFFIGGMVTFLIFLPNLIWMIQHHFPHLEMLANIKRNGRNVALGPIGFFGQQVLGMQPVAFPIWICGLWVFLFSEQGRPFKALGFAYLIALVALLLAQGRFYYLAAAYPMLIAGGAVAIERRLTAPRWRWVRPAYLSLLAVTGGLIALVALPILPPETYLRYTHFLHVSQPKFEHRQSSELPQMLADRLGWPEMAAAVAKVYQSIPADERARTAIVGQNYGEAGAIDFYGPKLGLPKAISGHVSYWYWGPRDYTGESMIVLGDIPRERLEQYFARVDAVGAVGNPYAMASEHFTIYLCREPKGGETLDQLWPKLKNWD
ncbi:MAG: glycosyltransferase family 39 protein [Candidatus Binatus sp.]|uniref:glycosyltransferase family 39 protein n=1 Tax=Candidatus Binatus sp. TaxID=2811406 RepID=UPI003C76E18F